MPVFVPVTPPRDPKECPAWLYEAITRLNRRSTASTQAIAAITRGEAPDSSGNPLVDTSRFFVKPGLSGGQIGFGGTNANDSLYLSSTTASDKGFIHLGYPSPRLSVDEDAGFVGIGTTAPATLLHLNTASAGTTTIGATGTPFVRASYGGTTLYEIVPIVFASGPLVYDVALKPTNAGFQVISTDGTAGMRLVPTSSRAFIQAGIKNAAGTVLNANMTLGGLGATPGSNLGVDFDQTWITSTGASPPMIGIGPGASPAVLSATWLGIVAGIARSATQPWLTVSPFSDTTIGPLVEFRTSLFGGAKTMSIEFDNTATSMRLTLWRNNTERAGYLLRNSSEFGGGRNKLIFYDASDRRTLSLDSGTLWNDSRTTTLLDMGDSVSSHKGVVLAGIDAAVLDRFAAMSLTTLFTDVLVGGAVAPPTALLHLRGASSNTKITLGVEKKSGQTGDLVAVLDTDGTTKLARFDSDGNLYVPGINAVVDDDGDVVTLDGEIVFSAVA